MSGKTIKELFADKELVKELVNCKTLKELQSTLQGHGVEIGDDDLAQVYDIITGVSETADGELDDAALEKIAGGAIRRIENFELLKML